MAASIVNITDVLDQPKLRPFQKLVIALCTLIVFVEGISAQAAGYIGPELREAWKLSPSELALFFSSALIGLMFGGIFVAPLADRVGRRPVLLGCVALFGICSIASAASTGIASLDILRFVTGLGIGGAMPNAIAMTAEYSPARRRSAMVAVMMTGFILGSVFAGLAAAPLVPIWGWQSLFVIGGVLPLLFLPVLLAALPESIRFLSLHEDARPAVAKLIKRIDPSMEVDASTRIVIEEHSASSVSVLALFREGRARSTVLLWIIYFMSLLNLYLFASWLTTHVRETGVSAATAILVNTMFQVGGAFGAVFGWMLDRAGPARTIFTAYIIAAMAIACISLAQANLIMLTVAVFVAGFGIIGGQNGANALAALSYPTHIRSTGVGWAIGIGRVGSIVGPGLAGILLQMGMTTGNIFYMAVIPALIAAAAGAAFGSLKRSPVLTERVA
jgi:AAHS family 4-hydroxybenzoate transporter-like MFS transporter